MQTEVNEYMEKGLAGQLVRYRPHRYHHPRQLPGRCHSLRRLCDQGSCRGSGGAAHHIGSDQRTGRIGSNSEEPYPASNEGYADGDPMPVIKKGRVWVPVEDAVTSESQAFVRFVADGAEQLGAFRSDVDGADAVALPGSKFVSDSEAGGLALLDLNLP